MHTLGHTLRHTLGHTRSAYRRDHLLQTPDTFVRTPLPGLTSGMAIVHTGSAVGAAFAQYTIEFAPGGRLGGSDLQRFLYVLTGEVALHVEGRRETLIVGSYAYLPASLPYHLSAAEAARVTVMERVQATGSSPLPMLVSHEEAVASTLLFGDPDLEVRALLPDGAGHDFAVNLMTYRPGASLPMVEIHVMEHGLLMLEGGGIYRLGDHWYPVTAGDFVWMAPFCPQWFGALGKQPAKYLIYKDWNQHPLR